jgi:hypothetical protein
MKRRSLLIAALFVANGATAFGQSKVLVLASRVTDNEYTFGRNAASPPTLTQRVLSATNVKRRSLRGLSLWESEVLVDSGVTDKFVSNDVSTDFMEVSGMRIDGQRAEIGQGGSAVQGTWPDGVQLLGQYCTIENCFFERFQGSAMCSARSRSRAAISSLAASTALRSCPAIRRSSTTRRSTTARTPAF